MIDTVEGEEKSLDSTSALEKVLRLDKKHTNFDYVDPVRSLSLRVSYPQALPQGPSSETLLKSLWKHANSYYFKKIEEGEYDRLRYIESVLHSPNEGSHRFIAEEEFWGLLGQTFSERYLQRYLEGDRERLDYHDWLQYLDLTWKVITTTDPKAFKKNQTAYDILKSNLREIYRLDHVTLRYKLELEREELAKFLEEEDDYGDDEVSEQIRRLEAEVSESNDSLLPIFQKLKKRVEYEAAVQDIIFCENEGSAGDDEQLEEGRCEALKMERKLAKLAAFETQTTYIEYIINLLERKQIAESVSKLYRLERQKGEVRVTLHFEEAMGIKPITISEEEFNEINQLREYSLLKYYNTASKSRYSFICQNFLCFKDIFENRSKPCKYRNKDIMEQMKKTAPDSLHAGYYREMNRMEICHHCKLLHHEDNLVTCEYHSNRYGSPIPPSPYYDSYIYQILKNEQSRVSAIRFLNSSEARRNSYFYYNRQNDEYVCGRKYCRYCLKNYEDGKEKSNGLCPYCRGICYCTRCSRNDMMVRLKSMYILMGGDINKLQRASLFERYYNGGEEAMDLRRKESQSKIPRKISGVPNRMNEKMLNIRFQLEDLRILCDLVKRREKNKEKLADCQRNIFRKKISHICPEFYEQKVELIERSEDEEEEESKVDLKLSEKLTKKLKRMIS